MLQRIVGIALLSLSLAACGGKDEPKNGQALTPPPIDDSPVALPAAQKADIEISWSAAELATDLKPSPTIDVMSEDGSVLLYRLSDGDDQSDGRTSGAFIRVPRSNLFDLSGLNIKVSITAKTALETPSSFRVAYSTATKGNSGWNDFEVGKDAETVSFSYLIPDGHDTTPDFIGFVVPDGSEVLLDGMSVSIENK